VRDHVRSVRDLIGAALAVASALAASGCGRGPARPHVELQVVGESTRLRTSDPLPATSPYFDGQTVRLRGARGEILGVQVLRDAAGEVPVSVAIEGEGVTVQGFGVEALPVVHPSTGMYGPSRGAGQYPDRLIAATGPVLTGRAAFFDVAIAAGAAAGERRGTLLVGDRRIPVVLRVEPVDLPAIDAAPRIWAYYDPKEVARDEGAEPGSDEAWQVELRFAALFRAHGVYASPELHVDDADRRLPLTAGFPYVPIILPTDPDEVAPVVQFFRDRLRGTGQRAFGIPIDEPRQEEQKREVRALAEAVRKAGGGQEVLYAVTDKPHEIYGDFIDIYMNPWAVSLAGATGRAERWTYNGSPPSAGGMILDTDGVGTRTWGWIAWRWKVPVWYVWDALYWHDRYSARRKGLARGTVPQSPIDRDAVTFDDGEDHGNLDGVLAFPGARPSLRLKTLRRGQEDRLLLDKVAACDRRFAESVAAALVPRALADEPRRVPAPGSWPTDEAPWEAARQKLLDRAIACAAGGAK